MLRVIASVWALMLGMFLLMVGNGLQGSLIGIRGAIEEFSTTELAAVTSAYFVGFLFGSRLAPAMIRRVGHVRVFAALGSFISAVLILYPTITFPWAWILMRVIIGFSFSGVYVTAESWLNNASPNESRGKATVTLPDCSDVRHCERPGALERCGSCRVRTVCHSVSPGLIRVCSDPACRNADACLRGDEGDETCPTLQGFSNRDRGHVPAWPDLLGAVRNGTDIWDGGRLHRFPDRPVCLRDLRRRDGSAISFLDGCRTGWTAAC